MIPYTLQTPAFRRPVPPEPVEVFDIPHPALPPALEGLRVLHISDLHVRRHAPGSQRWQRLIDAIGRVEADLVALTGDYADEPGHEGAALAALRRLADAWNAPRLGAYGIFGNHDTSELLRRAGEVRAVTWLGGPGRAPRWAEPCAGLRIVGLDYPEDFIAAALDEPARPPDSPRPFTIALAHYPTAVIPAAAAGLPLVLAGHTHAGQIRLSSRLAPHTSSDVPPHLAAGVLRLGETLCCVSRGLGDGVMEGLRFNCPRQAPLYVLRRGPLPDAPRGTDPGAVSQVVAW